MLTKQFTLSWLITFVAMMVYGFAVFGVLLSDFYAANSGGLIFRPVGSEKMEWLILGYIIISYALVRIFAYGYENKGIGEGLRFGLIIGLFWGSIEFINYALLPTTFISMWVSFIADIGLFVFSSIILSKVYSSTS